MRGLHLRRGPCIAWATPIAVYTNPYSPHIASTSLFGVTADRTTDGQKQYSPSAKNAPSFPNIRRHTHHSPAPSQSANITNGRCIRYFTPANSCRASHVDPFSEPFTYNRSSGLRSLSPASNNSRSTVSGSPATRYANVPSPFKFPHVVKYPASGE